MEYRFEYLDRKGFAKPIEATNEEEVESAVILYNYNYLTVFCKVILGVCYPYSPNFDNKV